MTQPPNFTTPPDYPDLPEMDAEWEKKYRVKLDADGFNAENSYTSAKVDEMVAEAWVKEVARLRSEWERGA